MNEIEYLEKNKLKSTKNIFISTGEISGDIHASYLAKELFKIIPNINISGFGSTEMKKLNINILEDLSYYSGVGLIENIRAIKPAILAYETAKKYFKENKIDLVILVDNQGFNIKLAQLTKKLNIKTIYYIGPQEWIWGIGNNWKKIIDNVDLLIAIFEKEYNFYKNKTDKVKYFGHPLKEIIVKKDKTIVKKELGYSNKKVIGIMAGSRKSEIEKLLPIFIDFSEKIKKYDNNIEIVFLINSFWKDFILTKYKINENQVFYDNSTYYMQGCDLILCASGTATLETAILDIPTIACYKLSTFSYKIAKFLVKLDYFTLPNIILNKKVISEFIQEEVNTSNLIKETKNIFDNNSNNILNSYKEVREKLNPKNTIENIALEIKKLFF